MTILQDLYGKEYRVPDLEAFKKHLQQYHSHQGKDDGSLHEENGSWFRVTEEFYSAVMVHS